LRQRQSQKPGPKQRRKSARSPGSWCKELLPLVTPFLPRKAAAARVGPQLRKACLRHDRLLEMRPTTVAANVTESAVRLALPPETFLEGALQYPVLFYQRPQSLARRARASAGELGISTAQFIRTALRHPPLFQLSPARLRANVAGAAAALGLTRKRYLQLALKLPTLLGRRPARLASNLHASAAALGMPVKELAAAVLRTPSLLLRRPESLKRFVGDAADRLRITPTVIRALVADTTWLLGVGRAAVLNAAIRNPAWFYLSAPTISLHALRASAHLKVLKAEYVAALLRSPTLVCRDPKRLAERAALVCQIARACGHALTPRGLLVKFPTALTYGAERLRERLAYARRLKQPREWTRLITMPARELERAAPPFG
jgi:hypothetical protein